MVPKGTHIIISPHAINSAEAIWGADARVFNPDRWLPRAGYERAAGGGADSSYAFMTFMHGPRSCIGLGFARAEFACLLAAWVGRFEFDLCDPSLNDGRKLDIRGAVSTRPANGLWVKVRVVERW